MEKEQAISLLDEMLRKPEKARSGPTAIRIKRSQNILIESCIIDGFPQAISAEDSDDVRVKHTAMRLPQEGLESSLSFLSKVRRKLTQSSPDRKKLASVIEYFKDKVAPQILTAVITWLRQSNLAN